MSDIKFFSDKINVKSKRVIIRSDFNVPILEGKIIDKTRIDICIPLINQLVEKKAKIILISHLGRPTKQNNKNFSLIPIFKYLKEKLKNKIYFFAEKIGDDTYKKTSYLKEGEIILFENLRFNDGEVENDDNFAKNLASLGEIYINDAFSCSHRKQSSIHKITNFLTECYASPQFMKEINSINIILKDKKKPITCIIGGSKVSTKIGVLTSLIKRVDNIIIVGAMANNFIYFKGNQIGKSLIEQDSFKYIKKILKEAEVYSCKIIIPVDCLVSRSLNGNCQTKTFNKISKDEIILDIGPKTIQKILNLIDESKTVLWNGPAGYFENKNFSTGTHSIAKKISDNTDKCSLLSIVGGGDTVSAVNSHNSKLNFTHLSTAGGAFLEFLEGKNLPGIEVLK